MLKHLLQLRVFQLLWPIIGTVSIRTKVLGIVLGTAMLPGTVVTVQV